MPRMEDTAASGTRARMARIERDTETAVVDPVCGMTVDPAKAPKSTYAGKTYYFCSADDKAKFDKNPKAYAKG